MYDNNSPIEIVRHYQDQLLREHKQREVWKKCYEYSNNWVDGDLGQWSGQIKSILGEKPALSFNEIKKFVNRICGSQRFTKVDEKAFPRDDQSDTFIAEILSDLLKYVKDVNDIEWHVARAFRDMVICGRGFLKAEWSDSNDVMGDITVSAINPFRVFLIGSGEKYDLSDRKAILEELPLTKEEILMLYPNSKESLSESIGEYESNGFLGTAGLDYFPDGKIDGEYFYNEENKKFKVLRCQKYEYKDINFLKNNITGELQEAQDIKIKDLKIAAELATQTTGMPHTIFKKKVKRVRIVTVCGNTVLDDEYSPYKHNKFDIIPIFAYTDGGMITGVVQDLLDAQDEKNKRRSQLIHILGTSAKNGYFYREGAFADPDLVKKEIGKVAPFIAVQGDLASSVRPIDSNLSAIPAIVQMEQQSVQDMKDITGIGDASLGYTPTGVKSGRGIQALQQPTETIIGELYENYILSRKLLAKHCIYLIQQFYTEPKRIRILGDYSSRLISPEVQQQIQAGLISIEEGSKIISINTSALNDISVGQYDVVIDQVSQNPTTRRSQYFDLLNMKSLGAPFKWSTVVKYSDIRGRMELLQDVIEAEQVVSQQGALSQLVEQDKSASLPRNPIEQDEGFNLAGMQQ